MLSFSERMRVLHQYYAWLEHTGTPDTSFNLLTYMSMRGMLMESSVQHLLQHCIETDGKKWDGKISWQSKKK
jgi:hypothetical protein